MSISSSRPGDVCSPSIKKKKAFPSVSTYSRHFFTGGVALFLSLSAILVAHNAILVSNSKVCSLISTQKSYRQK